MRLPATLCKIQRKKRETDGFSKSTWMTPPGSHPTSGFGARHGPPKFFGHKKRRIVQNDAANCHVLIKKMHTPKPCSATVCGIVTFLFRPFCEKYTKQSEPPHYQRLALS